VSTLTPEDSPYGRMPTGYEAWPPPATAVRPMPVARAAQPSGWTTAALFAVPALCTLLTCLYGIADRQVWRDEHATWWASTLSIHNLSKLVRNVDVVLLPYYLFMHVWIMVLGDSPTALRVPAAVAMAAAAGLLALLGRELFSARTGLLAGLLFTAVPNITHYGQEARPYSLAVAAAVGSTLLLVRALKRSTARSWVGYSLSLPALGWSHLVALTVLAAHVVVLLIDRRRLGRIPRWAYAMATLFGLSLVLPMTMAGTRQNSQIAWNNVGPHDLAVYPQTLFGSWPVAIAVMAAGLVGLAVSGRHAAMLAAWTLLPPLLTFATAAQLHLFLNRYLLFTVPAWTLLAAAAVTRLSGPFARHAGTLLPWRIVSYITGAAVLAGVVVVALPGYRTARADLADQPDFQGAARLILAGQQPGDGIMYDSSARVAQVVERLSMAYFFRHRAAPRDVLLKRTPQALGTYDGQECVQPNSCAAQARRIWLVTVVTTADPYTGLAPKSATVLRGQFQELRVTRVHDLRIVLLERIRPALRQGGSESLSGHHVHE